MNEIIVYAKIENEKVLIGTFDSLENIYEEVEAKLDYLNLPGLKTKIGRVYISAGFNEYRMIWGQQSSQPIVDKLVDVDY